MVDERLNLRDEDPVALTYNVDVYHMIYIIHMVGLGHCDHPGPLMVVYSVNKPRTWTLAEYCDSMPLYFCDAV